MFVAQIRASKIRIIEEYAEWPPEYLEEFGWMDITDVIPFPEVGWTYDGVDFSPPITTVFLRVSANKAFLQSDGVDILQITVRLERGNGNLIPVDRVAKIVLRKAGGAIYDILKINLVGGIKVFDYTATVPAMLTSGPQDAYEETIEGTTYRIATILPNTSLEIGREF